eukprot:TRINITY_DN181_c2_g3_i1.p1 TRINITY_DN181_c2_g3~~TRINITY_DN181_c2_g3_i1.p1  ORF type:complete len:448 (+),score=229.09 TRINITY_DN181_c2_g3_i1:248-1591(+)
MDCERVDVGTAEARGDGDADDDADGGEIEKFEIGYVDTSGDGGAERVGCSDFELLRLVGKGSFAKVFQVRRISTGRIYAMKVLRKATIVRKKKGPQHARTERTILQEVNHPFIVNLRYAFQTHGKLYLIMDFLNGGELFYHLRRSHMFSEARARFYACEILLAIEHLHSLGIVYRDLKPENLCLDHEGHVVLTDFGLAKEAVYNDHDAMSFCGTAEYMSPEILLRGGHGQSSDWWSFGVLLFEMLTGNPPFVGSNRSSTYSKVLKGKLTLPSYLTPDARGLLKRLLQRSVSKRLKTADEVRAQPFFAGVNWDDVRARRVPPLFVPDVSNEHDISNFDKSFTDATPTDSPAEPVEQLHEDLFQGFSYVAPSLREHMRRLSTSGPGGRGLSPLNPGAPGFGPGRAHPRAAPAPHVNTLHPGHQAYQHQPQQPLHQGGVGITGATNHHHH